MKNGQLYLASQSPSRKQLLIEAGFEFVIIPSGADEESLARDGFSLEDLTQKLAQLKMDHVQLPAGDVLASVVL